MYKKTTLPNGLRIITEQMAGTKTATVLVLVATGSKYETKNISGISHFLEHMTFKGTKKRPTPLHIAEPLDRIGAQYNAFTSQEYTGYYVKADASHLDLIMDIVADITINQKFDQKEINKESGVIIEEINMYNDSPARKVWDIWSDLLYGDQPAGWDVAGRKEVVAALKREDFVKYHHSHYVAKNTLLVVTGAINEKKVIEKAKVLFKNIRLNNGLPKLPVKESQKKPAIAVSHKTTDQSHLMIGVRTYDLWDKRRFALEILATILGGGMSSRLFQLLRDKLGAAYYVRTGAEFLTDHGFLVTSAGIDNKRAEFVIKSILNEYSRISREKVSPTELGKAKDHLKGGLVLGIETSDEIASFYGFQEILKKEIMKPEEIMEKIQAVTASQIQEVAKDIFRPEKLNLAMIGPFKNSGSFVKLLKI